MYSQQAQSLKRQKYHINGQYQLHFCPLIFHVELQMQNGELNKTKHLEQK